jgi:hypothetical protein
VEEGVAKLHFVRARCWFDDGVLLQPAQLGVEILSLQPGRCDQHRPVE